MHQPLEIRCEVLDQVAWFEEVDKSLPILEGLSRTSRGSGFCHKDNTDQAVMTRVFEIASNMEGEN